MREILFRGKQIDKCGWAYGGYYIVPDGEGGAIHRIAESDCEKYEYNDIMVDPSTVGQYTGLTANGKKVFEGDILRCIKTSKTAVVQYFPEHTAFMVFCKIDNIVQNLGECELKSLEIIGNIYDNPELLEAAE